MPKSLKLSSTHCVLLVLLLVLPLVFSAASAREMPNTPFVEEFNGTALDLGKTPSALQGWHLQNRWGHYSEVNSVIRLWTDGGDSCPLIGFYKQVSLVADFNFSCEVNAASLESCSIKVDNSLPFGKKEGFALEFGHYGAGMFLLSRQTGKDQWSWDSFGEGKENVWYTMQLSVFMNPFKVMAEVFDEKGNSLGATSTSDIENFTFNDIKYLSFYTWGLSPSDYSFRNIKTTFDDQVSAAFVEEFNGTKLDPAKWVVTENTNMSGYPVNGGSVKVANGKISLSSNGSSFPYVNSLINPFPLNGDFSVEFNLTYTCISDWGCGLWISSAPWQIFSERNSSADVIFQLWANNLDFDTAQIFADLMGKQVYLKDVPGWEPSASTQNFKLECSGGAYTLFIDGIEIASAKTQVRPTCIGFGHPPIYYLPFSPQHVASVAGGWGSFEIDYIKVSENISDNGKTSVALSVSNNLEALPLGLVVDVTGRLTYGDDEPLSGETIILSYSIPGTSTWNAIAAATTDSNGFYSVSWIPTATGRFIVKAEWSGNAIYSSVYAMKNVSVSRNGNQGVFFAESNSTISSLAFNSTSNEVSFTVSGPSGTNGFVRFSVSKELIPDQTSLKVFLDGRQLDYTVDTVGETWLINFEYTHSTHTVVISMLNSTTVDSSTLITAIIVSLAFAAPIGFAVLFTKRRKTKTYTQQPAKTLFD